MSNDLREKIADILAYHECRQNNPKADDPIWGYRQFSEDQRNYLRGLHTEAAADIERLIRGAQAEALEAAADDIALRLSGHSGISITRLRARAASIREGA